MRGFGMVALLAGALVAGDGLEGEITGGKARRLVDAAQPLLVEADAIYRAWVLETIPADDVKTRLRQAIRLYDDAAGKLQQALDIEYDPGVNHRCRLAARRLAKLRFAVYFKPAPAPPQRERPADETKPAKPKPEPKPTPPEKRLEREETAPPASVRFTPQAPPAMPVDVELPALPEPLDPDYQKLVKSDERAIAALLKDYFAARKPGKLLFRHRLCAGKGVFRDGTTCEECRGCGKQINLFHFRKIYWGSFSPLLRDSAGALAALKAFHAAAQGNPSALVPEVKAFQLKGVEHHGNWARARVAVSGPDGKSEQAFTVVSAGSNWYFYHPVADRELLEGHE